MQDEITLIQDNPDEVIFELNGTTIRVTAGHEGIREIVTDDNYVIYPDSDSDEVHR